MNECIHCGEEVSPRRVQILTAWQRPENPPEGWEPRLTCVCCAESTPQYRLEASHDATREDAPVFVLVTAASYSYGNPARLGRQTATYQGGRP